jgi:hypothetical protein
VGTAEDYRRLYGELGASGLAKGAKSAAVAAPEPVRKRSSTKAHTGKKTPRAKAPTRKAAPKAKTKKPAPAQQR